MKTNATIHTIATNPRIIPSTDIIFRCSAIAPTIPKMIANAANMNPRIIKTITKTPADVGFKGPIKGSVKVIKINKSIGTNASNPVINELSPNLLFTIPIFTFLLLIIII